jgi:uncharacterized cupredoxin-like copper-binding protein
MARTRTVLLILALLVSACGSGEGVGGSSSGTDEEVPAGEGMSEHDMEGMEEGGFAFGTPADETQATRTIEVRTSDELIFEPAEVSVQQGETVMFRVINEGNLPHDFVLGDEATQEEHAAEMAASEEDMQREGMEHGEANAISVPAGETVDLTWTFDGDTEGILYGCHEPGHYEAGMVGRITVEA